MRGGPVCKEAAMVWTLHSQQQQRGAQLHARGRPSGSGPRQAGESPTEAVAGREAQDHEHAAEDVAGEQAQPGESPASRLEDRDGDLTPTVPEPGASWDEAVQPERRRHPRGGRWDDQPLPEGK
jgi:hypothetical protein